MLSHLPQKLLEYYHDNYDKYGHCTISICNLINVIEQNDFKDFINNFNIYTDYDNPIFVKIMEDEHVNTDGHSGMSMAFCMAVCKNYFNSDKSYIMNHEL